MEKNLLAQKIFEACYLKGVFTLRSGKISNEYFDKYAMEAQPRLLEAVAGQLAPLVPKDTEILAALEMGGIPLGTALSLKTGLPLRFVRKKAKPYGTMRLCEGGEIKGKKLCVIEDVITTGGQALESVKELRERGAVIHSVVCVICRGGYLAPIEKEGLKLISLFDKEEIKKTAAASPPENQK